MEAVSWFHETTPPCPKVQAHCCFYCLWMLSGVECSLIGTINQSARHKNGYKREREGERERRIEYIKKSSPEAQGPRWTFSSLGEDNSRHNQSFPFFFIVLCGCPHPHPQSPHPAFRPWILTKMKVYVSPRVGVAMETTVIQRSQQWLLNKRSCLMELKE